MSPAPARHDRGAYAVRCVVVAVGYMLSGKLGLLLAIPPGYATAVWPASGIALAALILGGRRLWPGVLLGSVLVNLWTSLDATSTETVLRSIAVALSIGAGAALQAVTGATLIARFAPYQNLLLQETGSVQMLLLGGPVSCIVNASVGAGALWFAGLAPSDALLFTWWTWWVGDAIGVIIFTPLVLIWALPGTRWRRRQLAITLPLVALFASVVWLFFFTSAREDARIEAQFQESALRHTEALRSRLEHLRQILRSMERFYTSSEEVDAAEFRRFTQTFLEEEPGLTALSFNERVSAADLEAWQQLTGLTIRTAAPPLDPTDPHVVIRRIEPLPGNEHVLGVDVYGDPVRREALDRAARLDRAQLSAPVQLLQGDRRDGALLVMPVRRPRLAPSDPAPLMGFAVAAFNVADLVASLGSPESGLVFELEDISGSVPAALYDSHAPPPRAGDRRFEADIPFAGRQWRAVYRLPEAERVRERSWQAWWLLATGLAYTGMLGGVLLVLTGRESAVQLRVQQQTAEIRTAQDHLNELLERLRRSNEDLERSNAELEQFAYVASHDLQAPLRGIVGFAQLLEKRYAAQLDESGREMLALVGSSGRHMQSLITDLLALARVGRQTERTLQSGENILALVLTQLQPQITERGAVVTHEPLPTLLGTPLELTQLFQNLVGNAIKFGGAQPKVHLGVRREGAYWHFTVTDSGIGIPPEHRERIFQPFKRLHDSSAFEGTGIGLAICKKVVTHYGGRIWVDAAPEGGTVFHFTLPAAPQ